MQNKIMVSISCVTYNHEDYISDAIKGFLMQKTDFRYEILVHDDASTDRTAEIIKKYEKKYPEIIKPIYQKENQYSKGLKVEEFNRKRANGRYYALCEGDDYWTDPYKLQKQVDLMERNPVYSVCVHAANVVDAATNRMMPDARPDKRSRVFSVQEVIKGGGGLFMTNSMLYRRELYSNLPDFYYNAPVGDYPLIIFLAIKGRVFYIDEPMSVYRMNVKNSWTAREFSTLDRKIAHFGEIGKMLDEINLYTNYKYNEAIMWAKMKNEFHLLREQGEVTKMRNSKYYDHYLELDVKNKIHSHMKVFCPGLLNFLTKTKRRYKQWAMK